VSKNRKRIRKKKYIWLLKKFSWGKKKKLREIKIKNKKVNPPKKRLRKKLNWRLKTKLNKLKLKRLKFRRNKKLLNKWKHVIFSLFRLQCSQTR
jgi:hypothetical protein